MIDTALMSAVRGLPLEEARGDRDYSGLCAIEVKSGREREDARRGLDSFIARYAPPCVRLVGSGGTPLEDFLAE